MLSPNFAIIIDFGDDKETHGHLSLTTTKAAFKTIGNVDNKCCIGISRTYREKNLMI